MQQKTLYSKVEVIILNDNLRLRVYISQRIKYLRTKKGLKQDELAELSDLDTKHISRIENNAPNLELETVEKLIDALGETNATFFNWKFPTNSEELRKLNNSLDELSVEDQKEVIDALTLLVNKMNKSL